MIGCEDGAYELALSSVHGRIWDRRPKVTREGVIGRVLNTRKRSTDSLPVVFQAVAFSGDGQTCAAADKRGHLYLFYLQLNRFSLVKDDGPGPAPDALCFTQRRHEEVVCAAKNLVKAYDADTHRNTAELRGHTREVHVVCASGLSGLVLTQSPDLSIVWDVKDWSKRRSLQARAAPMCGASFTPLGDLCGILFRDSRIALWRTTTFTFERELIAPQCADERDLNLRHFAANARHIVAGGAGGMLIVWSLARKRMPVALEAPQPVVQLQLGTLQGGGSAGSPGSVIFVLQNDGQLFVAWLRSLQVLLTVDLQFRAICAFEVSSHSKYLAVAVSDGCLELRDLSRAVEHEQRCLEQRIQLGAPQHLLRKTLVRVSHPWVEAENVAGNRRHGVESEHKPWIAHEKADPDDDAAASHSAQELTDDMRHFKRKSPGRHSVHLRKRAMSTDARSQPEEDHPPRQRSNDSARVGFSSGGSAERRFRQQQHGRDLMQSARRRSDSSDPPSSSSSGPPPVKGARDDGLTRPTSSARRRKMDADERELRESRPPRSISPLGRGAPDPEMRTEQGADAELLSPRKARKLRDQLRQRGVYPEADRPQIWRQLLQLPYNRHAYDSLVAAGIHPRFRNLHEHYPGHTRGSLQRLARLLSALAHWSRAWAEVPYLPALAFPFLKVFGQEPVIAFEMIVTVLLNWARSWLDELPGPPLKVLTRLDDLLVSVDPVLHGHLRLACEAPGIARTSAVHLTVLWPLLQSLLTEVLPKAQWLQLWDHLITHWVEPELLLAAVVAFLRCARASLLELPPRAPIAVEEWLRRPQRVLMPALLENMYELQAEAMTALPTAAVDPILDTGVLGEAGLSRASGPQLPLPRGQYPSISVYPHLLAESPRTDVQQRRGRTTARLSSHRDQLVEVKTAVEQLTQEEERFREQQEELLKAEASRRRVAMEEEDRLFDEKREADERLMERRLAEVRKMYSGVERSLQQQQELRSLESKQLLDELKRKHRERSYEIEARMKEEAVLNLEMRGMQTVTDLLMKRRDEENFRSLQQHVRSTRREQELQDEVQRAAWRIEDEREGVRLQSMRQQQIRADQREAELRQRREVEMELRLEELERQLQVAQVGRERVVRRAQQDAQAMTEVSDNLQRRRHELASRAERREQALAIAEERRFQRAKSEERQKLVERESSRWRLDMELRGEKLSDLVADQVRRDYEARSKQLQEEDGDRDKAGEDVLRKAMLRVDGVRHMEEERATEQMRRDQHTDAFGSSAAGVASDAPLAGPQEAPAFDIPGGVAGDEEALRRERKLEELIKQREAELEALWREFDDEARELTDEEQEAVLLGAPGGPGATAAGQSVPAAGPLRGAEATCRSCGNTGVDFTGQPCSCYYGQQVRQQAASSRTPRASSMDAGSSAAAAPSLVAHRRAHSVEGVLSSRAQRRPPGGGPLSGATSHGGPLAGAWGLTSDDSSSGEEALRQLRATPAARKREARRNASARQTGRSERQRDTGRGPSLSTTLGGAGFLGMESELSGT